jgi:hypothetical protein
MVAPDAEEPLNFGSGSINNVDSQDGIRRRTRQKSKRRAWTTNAEKAAKHSHSGMQSRVGAVAVEVKSPRIAVGIKQFTTERRVLIKAVEPRAR